MLQEGPKTGNSASKFLFVLSVAVAGRAGPSCNLDKGFFDFSDLSRCCNLFPGR